MTKKEIIKFINSAINQRKVIVRKKRNHKNNALIEKTIFFLESYTPGLNSTPIAARFFINNFNKIKFLLPPNRISKAEDMLAICQAINSIHP